jgi:hypothetical protein
MRLANIPFRIESLLFRTYYEATGARPGSAPFISGDTFRGLADQILEKDREIDLAHLRPSQIVFVEQPQIPHFVKDYLPKIKVPFVLITHNGDTNIDDSYRYLADDRRIRHWFTQNALIQHPKVTGIPLGLENRNLHTHGVIHDFRALQSRNSRKITRILFGFTVGNNQQERLPALNAFRCSTVADSMERINSRAYRKRLARYAFVASPPGSGMDCHRTWEALYLRTIPIVRRSRLYDSFPGLPVLAVDDWSEITDWDVQFLEKTYERLSSELEKTPLLRFEYWADLIRRSSAQA